MRCMRCLPPRATWCRSRPDICQWRFPAARCRCSPLWRGDTATPKLRPVWSSRGVPPSIKKAPSWSARVAAAHTVPRELRAFAAQVFDPEIAAKITMPVLLLAGADSPDEVKANPEAVAAALPNARIGVLKGQAHIAHLTDPQSFAERVISFLRD